MRSSIKRLFQKPFGHTCSELAPVTRTSGMALQRRLWTFVPLRKRLNNSAPLYQSVCSVWEHWPPEPQNICPHALSLEEIIRYNFCLKRIRLHTHSIPFCRSSPHRKVDGRIRLDRHVVERLAEAENVDVPSFKLGDRKLRSPRCSHPSLKVTFPQPLRRKPLTLITSTTERQSLYAIATL